ncbi:MAG: M23 family metallopeptidase [Chloroflexi bacterium]|nr:M23 family metallopeptidase [Chloroflexota bacterium]
MFEGISEIASRVGELQTALDNYNSRASGTSSGEGSFQQTLNQVQGADGSTSSSSYSMASPTGSAPQSGASRPAPAAGADTAPLRPTAYSGAQLAGRSMTVGTTGATQMPSTPTTAALAGLGLGGAGGASGLGGLLGGDTSGLGGLLGGAGFGMLGGVGDLGSLAGASGEAYGSQAGAIEDGLSAGGQSGSMAGLVGQIAQSQGVNPALAEAVAHSESGFNPQAVSPAGAQGLMQLMPGTFKSYAPQAGGAMPSGVPVQGASVTQSFGPTSFGSEPALDWNGTHYAHFHTGVDLAAAQGTPIRATVGGKVEVRSDPGGFGNLMVVRSGPWDVLYGHTSGHPDNIQTGSIVKPGDIIGYVGSTGNSTGPHVHYELRYNGQIIDPAPFLQGAGGGGSQASPFDPVANAKAGVGYLKDMLTRFKNNVPQALAAYNAGPNAVAQYGGVPPYPETQNYVQKTMQYAHELGA